MPDIHLNDGDYTLDDGRAWFTVRNISIRITTTDEGVYVDMYPLNRECGESIASAYAFFSEANPEE